MSVNWPLGVCQIAKWCHSIVKEKDYTSQRLRVKRKAAGRNEKAVYNKAHRDGKKERTSKYVNEKLWLKRMDMES